MCLQQDLRDQGMDPDKLSRHLRPHDDRATMRRCKAGDIDVMQAFEPFVSMAEKDGAGDILYAASTRGPTAYTAFIATRDACAKHRDEFAAMTRAIAKMLAVALRQPRRRTRRGGGVVLPATCRRTSWPARCAAIKDAGLWSRETRMIPQGFARLGAKPAFRWIHRPHAGL